MKEFQNCKVKEVLDMRDVNTCKVIPVTQQCKKKCWQGRRNKQMPGILPRF